VRPSAGRGESASSSTRSDGEEPPAFVVEAMADATVILAPTTFSLSHTRARIEATGRGTRIATMPGITAETFQRALAVDRRSLTRVAQRIAAELGAASTCRVTSRTGTDVVLDLEGSAGVCDDGDLRAEGAWGNLPAGEAFIAPVETHGEGTIVFDGALTGYGLLHEQLRVTLSGGRAVEAVGEAAQWLLEALDAGGSTGRSIVEVGIGTNPRATLTGSILEDEKVLGRPTSRSGRAPRSEGRTSRASTSTASCSGRTVELDGRPLIRDGELVDRTHPIPADGAADRLGRRS
jgi:leucyl aminopeptidase (aminopeptidase T)